MTVGVVMTRANQNAQVLASLRSRGEAGLTPLDALREIGSFRLGARVWDLRQSGYDIETRMVDVDGKRFARYVLREVTQGTALEMGLVG